MLSKPTRFVASDPNKKVGSCVSTGQLKCEIDIREHPRMSDKTNKKSKRLQ